MSPSRRRVGRSITAQICSPLGSSYTRCSPVTGSSRRRRNSRPSRSCAPHRSFLPLRGRPAPGRAGSDLHEGPGARSERPLPVGRCAGGTSSRSRRCGRRTRSGGSSASSSTRPSWPLSEDRTGAAPTSKTKPSPTRRRTGMRNRRRRAATDAGARLGSLARGRGGARGHAPARAASSLEARRTARGDVRLGDRRGLRACPQARSSAGGRRPPPARRRHGRAGHDARPNRVATRSTTRGEPKAARRLPLPIEEARFRSGQCSA